MEVCPSRMLLDYEWVYEHPKEPERAPPEERVLRGLREHYQKNAAKFLETLNKMQVAFWEAQAVAAGKSAEWDGKGRCPTCKRGAEGRDEGSERAMTSLRQFIVEHPCLG